MIATVDASVWTATVIRGDLFHPESTGWMRHWIGSGHELFSPVLLLAEVAGAVSRRTRTATLSLQVIHRLHNEPQMHLVTVDSDLALEAAQLAANLHLKGADAIYVALAQQLNVPLVTWDREQLERAGQIIAVMTPAQAMERME